MGANPADSPHTHGAFNSPYTSPDNKQRKQTNSTSNSSNKQASPRVKRIKNSNGTTTVNSNKTHYMESYKSSNSNVKEAVNTAYCGNESSVIENYPESADETDNNNAEEVRCVLIVLCIVYVSGYISVIKHLFWIK